MRYLLSIFTLILVTAMPLTVFSSGSYGGKAITPGKKIDRAQYTLGKSVFKGKATFEEQSQDQAQKQEALLADLEKAIFEKTKRKVALKHLAGKISQKQYEALQYYISIRFRIQN